MGMGDSTYVHSLTDVEAGEEMTRATFFKAMIFLPRPI